MLLLSLISLNPLWISFVTPVKLSSFVNDENLPNTLTSKRDEPSHAQSTKISIQAVRKNG